MGMEVVVDDTVLMWGKVNTLVGAIDQGTSSTRFLVFTPKGEIAAWAQMEHRQIFPEGEDKVCGIMGLQDRRMFILSK